MRNLLNCHSVYFYSYSVSLLDVDHQKKHNIITLSVNNMKVNDVVANSNDVMTKLRNGSHITTSDKLCFKVVCEVTSFDLHVGTLY